MGEVRVANIGDIHRHGKRAYELRLVRCELWVATSPTTVGMEKGYRKGPKWNRGIKQAFIAGGILALTWQVPKPQKSCVPSSR